MKKLGIMKIKVNVHKRGPNNAHHFSQILVEELYLLVTPGTCTDNNRTRVKLSL
jgi:hypothetical protein